MLLGLDPRYRRRDDRLDTRVFSTVLAVIGAGLAFLLTVVALSFPQWIGPRTFVSRLIPSARGEVPAVVRPLPVLTTSPIELIDSRLTAGDADEGAAAAAPSPGGEQTEAVVDQPPVILAQAVQARVIDIAESHDSAGGADLPAGPIADPGTIAGPGATVDPSVIVDPAPVIDPAPPAPPGSAGAQQQTPPAQAQGAPPAQPPGRSSSSPGKSPGGPSSRPPGRPPGR